MEQTPPSKLEDLIGTLQAPGVESEGQFSLNPERARELLRRYQLDHASYSVLHLLSFLVGLYPEAIDITCHLSKAQKTVLFWAPRVRLEEPHLRNPFLGLLRKGEAHLEELSIGLNTAMGIDGCCVDVRSGGFQGLYQENRIQVEPSLDQCDGVRIELRRPLLRSNPDDATLEEALIRDAFRFCPLVLTLNGKTVSGPVPSGHSVYEWLHHNPEDPLWTLPDEGECRVQTQHKARFSCLVTIGDVEPVLQIIHLGRLYTQAMPWGLEGSRWFCSVTVSTTRCKRDLSQRELLQEKVFANLLAHIQRQFFATLIGQCEPLASGARPPGELVDMMIDHLFQAGERDQAYQLQRDQHQRDWNGRDRLRRGISAYRFGLLEWRRGARDQAESLLASSKEELDVWRSPRDIFFQGYRVAPTALVNWLKARADYYLGQRDAQLLDSLVKLATLSRGCWPLELAAYRWAFPLSRGEHHLVEERLRYARVLRLMGQLSEARLVLERLRHALSEAERDSASGWELDELLGEVMAELGETRPALQFLSAALERKRNVLGSDSVELGLLLKKLILLLQHTGDLETARHYEKWVARLEV